MLDSTVIGPHDVRCQFINEIRELPFALSTQPGEEPAREQVGATDYDAEKTKACRDRMS